MRDLGFQEDEDPFALDGQHPIAKLQFTTRAFVDWIAHRRIEPVRQGALELSCGRLSCAEQCQAQFLSTMDALFVTLFRLHCAMINTHHEYGEKTRYRDAEEHLTGGLIVGKKWNLSQHRKLCLLTTSLSLPHIDEHVN